MKVDKLYIQVLYIGFLKIKRCAVREIVSHHSVFIDKSNVYFRIEANVI